MSSLHPNSLLIPIAREEVWTWPTWQTPSLHTMSMSFSWPRRRLEQETLGPQALLPLLC